MLYISYIGNINPYLEFGLDVQTHDTMQTPRECEHFITSIIRFSVESRARSPQANPKRGPESGERRMHLGFFMMKEWDQGEGPHIWARGLRGLNLLLVPKEGHLVLIRLP